MKKVTSLGLMMARNSRNLGISHQAAKKLHKCRGRLKKKNFRIRKLEELCKTALYEKEYSDAGVFSSQEKGRGGKNSIRLLSLPGVVDLFYRLQPISR